MTPTGQRIACAELLGWTLRTEGLLWSESEHRAMILPGSALADVRSKMNLPMENALWPDPLSDLNAVARLEAKLTDTELFLYGNDLSLECGNFHRAICATAAQRVEAILKACGKWKP